MRQGPSSHLSRIPGLCLLLMAGMTVHAAPPAEVQHLLDYIGESGCQFIRNGTASDAVEARDHMLMKYEYVGDRISNGSQFIEYLATGSSISGRPYLIDCPEFSAPATSAEWLTKELERYRSSQQR